MNVLVTGAFQLNSGEREQLEAAGRCGGVRYSGVLHRPDAGDARHRERGNLWPPA